MLHFIKPISLALTYAQVQVEHHLNLIDLGYVKGGEVEYYAFRLANDSTSPVNYRLSTDDERISFVPSSTGTIPAYELSGTISLKLTVPSTTETREIETDIIAHTALNEDVLRLYYGTVGALEEHTEFTSDEQAGEFTDSFDAITRWASQTIRLYTFQPIDYTAPDESARRIEVDPNGFHKIVSCHSHCQRTNPMNAICGYRRTWAIVGAAFSEEEISENEAFSTDDTSGGYDHFANLYIPPTYDMSAKWGRFEFGDSLEPEQCKKTVRVFKRLGRLFHLAEVELLEFKKDIAQYQARCREIHIPTSHARTFNNPFSITYERNSHKVYQVYQCWEGLRDLLNYIPDGAGNGSGSLAGSLHS